MTDIEIPEGFTRWDGQERENLHVEVILRIGDRLSGPHARFDWSHRTDESDYDIIAYRIVPDA